MPADLKSLAATAVSAAAILAASTVAGQDRTPQNQATRISPIQVSGNSVRVSYRDLNLDTEAGLGVMRSRISAASYVVCGVDMQPLSVQMARLACVSDARRGAFNQLAAVRARVHAPAELALILPIER